MQITLQLEAETAHQLRYRQPPNDATRELLSAIEELHVELQPIHAGLPDHELGKYFSVEVADGETGERVRETLASCSGVEGAYLKPADELP